MRFKILAILTLVVGFTGTAVCKSALAQKSGVYSGTTSDGQAISITVSTDSLSGKQQVSRFSQAAFQACNSISRPNYQANIDLTNPPFVDLTSRNSRFVYYDAQVWVAGLLRFFGDQVIGEVQSATAAFDPSSPPSAKPKRVIYCNGGLLGFTATLQNQ